MLLFFQLLKTNLKLRKKSFIGQRFFVGPIRGLFSQLKSSKQTFSLQNSKFRQIRKSPEETPRTQFSEKKNRYIIFGIDWFLASDEQDIR